MGGIIKQNYEEKTNMSAGVLKTNRSPNVLLPQYTNIRVYDWLYGDNWLSFVTIFSGIIGEKYVPHEVGAKNVYPIKITMSLVVNNEWVLNIVILSCFSWILIKYNHNTLMLNPIVVSCHTSRRKHQMISLFIMAGTL